MRDPNRIDIICDTLKELWYRFPDYRFTQLLSNFVICSSTCDGDNINFYQEDNTTYSKIRYTLEQLDSIEM